MNRVTTEHCGKYNVNDILDKQKSRAYEKYWSIQATTTNSNNNKYRPITRNSSFRRVFPKRFFFLVNEKLVCHHDNERCTTKFGNILDLAFFHAQKACGGNDYAVYCYYYYCLCLEEMLFIDVIGEKKIMPSELIPKWSDQNRTYVVTYRSVLIPYW